MNDYMDEPRRSGTVLKVVLIIITIIAVVAAVAMGLLFYNAKSSVDSFRERNDALSDELKKAQAQLSQIDTERAEYEKQITSLTEQLQDAQAQLEMMVPAVNDPDNPDANQPSGGSAIIDLSDNKDLAVKPTSFYEAGVDYTVSVKGLNVRSGPGTTYKALASVNQNSTITAYAEDDDWLLISYKDNAYGWVKASFVTKK